MTAKAPASVILKCGATQRRLNAKRLGRFPSPELVKQQWKRAAAAEARGSGRSVLLEAFTSQRALIFGSRPGGIGFLFLLWEGLIGQKNQNACLNERVGLLTAQPPDLLN